MPILTTHSAPTQDRRNQLQRKLRPLLQRIVDQNLNWPLVRYHLACAIEVLQRPSDYDYERPRGGE